MEYARDSVLELLEVGKWDVECCSSSSSIVWSLFSAEEVCVDLITPTKCVSLSLLLFCFKTRWRASVAVGAERIRLASWSLGDRLCGMWTSDTE